MDKSLSSCNSYFCHCHIIPSLPSLLLFFTQVMILIVCILWVFPVVLQTSELSAGQNFLSGVIAGTMACVITQPADVVKTRLQLFPQKYCGNMDAIVDILKVSIQIVPCLRLQTWQLQCGEVLNTLYSLVFKVYDYYLNFFFLEWGYAGPIQGVASTDIEKDAHGSLGMDSLWGGTVKGS